MSTRENIRLIARAPLVRRPSKPKLTFNCLKGSRNSIRSEVRVSACRYGC